MPVSILRCGWWCTRAWAGPSGAIRARSKQEAGCEEACQANAEWQRVIPKSQWKKTDPVKLVVTDNRMELELE
ncbi:protein of unknown function [Burkholderia multivorans]